MLKTASLKAKGRRLQKFFCQKVADAFKFRYNQQDDTCPIHSREMGQSGTDIIIRDKKLLKLFPYAVECKNVEKVSINKMIKQAKQNAEKANLNWLICYKNNRLKNPVIILDIDVFMQFFKTKRYI